MLSSWVRPGVLEVRARLVVPVSALSSDDFPTLERGEGDLNPVHLRQVGDAHAAFDENEGPREQQPRGLGKRKRCVVHQFAGLSASLGLRLNVLAMLPNRFTSAPWRFMMKYCWQIDRKLFQLQ